MKLFLDMDGVVADFVSAAQEVHGQYGTFTDPKNRGIFDLENIWGITSEQFWKPIDDLGQSFWACLDKTPEADMLVALAEESVGKNNVAVLTAPSRNPGCYLGKFRWIDKNYPQFRGKVIFASAGVKSFMAGPDKILIDDRDENVAQFCKAGGHGVLVPRMWNKRHAEREVMENVRAQMNRIWERNNGRNA